MKIAILLRGHTRNHQDLYENFTNSILKYKNKYQIKIFIHTWNTVNHNISTEISEENIKKLYDPIDIFIETQTNNIDNIDIIKNNKNRDKFKYQLYEIYALKNMVKKYEVENNMTFDYYFHTRFDMHYHVCIEQMLEFIRGHNIIIHPKYTYYDMYCFIDNKFIDDYSNMIIYDFRKIKNKYKSYGINPIIDYIIKQKGINKTDRSLGFICKKVS